MHHISPTGQFIGAKQQCGKIKRKKQHAGLRQKDQFEYIMWQGGFIKRECMGHTNSASSGVLLYLLNSSEF